MGISTILAERVREYTQKAMAVPIELPNGTSGVATVSDRNYRREHPGWTTTQKQEWGLFIL